MRIKLYHLKQGDRFKMLIGDTRKMWTIKEVGLATVDATSGKEIAHFANDITVEKIRKVNIAKA